MMPKQNEMYKLGLNINVVSIKSPQTRLHGLNGLCGSKSNRHSTRVNCDSAR